MKKTRMNSSLENSVNSNHFSISRSLLVIAKLTSSANSLACSSASFDLASCEDAQSKMRDASQSCILYPASCNCQYKSSGLSFNVPVAGSTSKPKDSKTTTPSKTLSIKTRNPDGKGIFLPLQLYPGSTSHYLYLSCSCRNFLLAYRFYPKLLSYFFLAKLSSSLQYQPMRLALRISSSQDLIFQLLSTNVPFLSLVSNIGNAHIKTSL